MVAFNKNVEEQARYLASDNRQVEPLIEKVFWFPHSSEVRLVEVMGDVPANLDCRIAPFYFRPSPQDNLPNWTAVALIRPEEYRQLSLPEGWGSWDDGVEIE